jgi:sugar/nucleoside kinase (ribokinase family)
MHHSGDEWAIGGASVDVVDSVGAGDAFTAGLIDALAWRDGSAGLEAARDAAASVLARRGELPAPAAEDES